MAAIGLPSFAHLTADLGEDWPYVVYRFTWRFGSQAAFLFVFLSGFMVAGPLMAKLKTEAMPTARVFFTKRLRRIVPIAFGAVLFTALLDALSRTVFNAERLYQGSYAYDMIEATSWTNLVGNLLFLQPVFVDAFGSNGPLWTLGYIVQYYAIGWAFCKFYSKNKILGLIALIFALTAMALASAEWAVLLVSWLGGGLARQISTPKLLRVPFMLLGAAIFVASNLASPLLSAALSIPVGFLVTQAIMHGPAVPRLATNTWLRKVSNDSYVIYAVHHPVLMSVWVVLFGGAVGSNPRFLLYVAASGVAVLAASVILTKLVNRLVAERVSAAGRKGKSP
jgi:peptidoglycan/LPS O-acetylase OafA/YrhL